MTSRAAVDRFLAGKRMALIGASRDKRKFGNMILKELRRKRFEIVPIHPVADEIEGTACVKDLEALPEGVDRLIICVQPEQTEQIVSQCAAAGIRHVWMQQGAGSERAEKLCEEQGVAFVNGECVLMFAEPIGFVHRVHRWIWAVLGRLPR